MLNNTPPFAVPSNLVIVIPVKPTASSNISTWLIAFWPVPASTTNITSCGAVASIFCITRLTLVNSCIRLLLLCKRPAVSAISTSMPLARALSNASKITEALSAPWPCATTATSLRSPQICNCSVAAARKVSPAASMTFLPSPCKRFANLPMVVVLPTPFTPTTKIT